jgi:hypothetical protein
VLFGVYLGLPQKVILEILSKKLFFKALYSHFKAPLSYVHITPKPIFCGNLEKKTVKMQ